MHAKSVFLTIAILFLSRIAGAAQPQIVSLTPSSGSGQTQAFTLTASDSAGASDIDSIDMLINSTFDKTNACWIYFHGGLISLATDQGYWLGGMTDNTHNSQCSVQLNSSSSSGNNVSFTVTITFSSAWLGAKTIWGESLDKAKNDSQYQQVGTYTAVHDGPTQDFSVSVTPDHLDSTPGHTVMYSFTIASINGLTGDVSCNATASPQPSGLQQFAGFGNFSASTTTLPVNGTKTGTLWAIAAQGTPPTSNITLTVTCQDASLQHSAQTTLNIASPATPTVSITPTSGTASTETFTISATDPGGYAAIGQMNFLINSSFDGRHACWLFYQSNPNNPPGTLILASDDGTDWSRSTAVSSDPTIITPVYNSQCSVFGGPTTVTGTGDTLTLTLTLTFTSSFAGPKNMYLRAADQGGPDSGYQPVGIFTTVGASSAPDFSITVTPASQTITGQSVASYSVTVQGDNGYMGTVNLSASGLPPNSTLSPAPGNIGPGKSTLFTIHTTGSTPAGAYTVTVTGTDGALSHTQTAVLNVQAAPVPTLSASPDTGAGSTQTFTFIANGTDDQSTPVDMNVLFNTTVDGSHACWIYAGRYGIALASDDGTLWLSGTNTNRTMQNSQCTVTWTPTIDSAPTYSLKATITFSSSFTGTKNIFMRADNNQGGDTGYQLKGAWTVQ